jgi:hypothetical protein
MIRISVRKADIGGNFSYDPTSGGRSLGIFRSRTQATEFVLFVCLFRGLFSLLLRSLSLSSIEPKV